jgi:hypothetical protein
MGWDKLDVLCSSSGRPSEKPAEYCLENKKTPIERRFHKEQITNSYVEPQTRFLNLFEPHYLIFFASQSFQMTEKVLQSCLFIEKKIVKVDQAAKTYALTILSAHFTSKQAFSTK